MDARILKSFKISRNIDPAGSVPAAIEAVEFVAAAGCCCKCVDCKSPTPDIGAGSRYRAVRAHYRFSVH